LPFPHPLNAALDPCGHIGNANGREHNKDRKKIETYPMKKLNWPIILSNIAEAREQLQQIEARANTGEKISEVEFQILLEHAYHHLNFAWQIRHTPTKRYANLTDEDFNLWSKYPKEIKAYRVEKPEGKRTDERKPKTETKRGSRSRKGV
jgi:hypothetical protein